MSKHKKFDVVCFGSAVVDMFLDTDIAESAGKAGGRVMAYPVGSKILMKNLRFDVGGGGTNTAVAFARFGFKTGYIGKIGDEGTGLEILDCLKEEKIKFLGKIAKGEMSGYSVILDSKEHNRTILTYKGVANKLKYSELNVKKIDTDWLYLCTMLGESFKTQKKLAMELHKKGVRIAFNPTEYLIKKEYINPLLPYCDVFILNKEEAQMLVSGDNTKILARNLFKLGPKVVVITDRDKPMIAYDGKKISSLKPHKIKVVERTGAGDAFAAGFTAGRIIGKDIDYCLRLGLRESESVIRYLGAKNKLLRMDLKK